MFLCEQTYSVYYLSYTQLYTPTLSPYNRDGASHTGHSQHQVVNDNSIIR